MSAPAIGERARIQFPRRADGTGRFEAATCYTELGGATQTCEFDPGLYLNPGPWRIPYHHYAILDYCRRFGVALEPFIQLNHNAYFHSADAFGGKPQRIREIKADYDGGVAELLAKATKKGALDDAVSKEDQEILLEALRALGALDQDFRYRAGDASARHRGYAKLPGGGLGAAPIPGEPIGLNDILTSRLWSGLQSFLLYDFQTTMFQPVGGMGRIGEAFARQIPGSHPLWREGRRHPPERQRRDDRVRGSRGWRNGPGSAGPTGACARFRSAS